MRPAAGRLAPSRVAGEADANDEPLGVFVFAGVRFALGRVQEESSAPHLRLAYIHLQNSSDRNYRLRKKE
jgi:hypothetical protein